MAERDNHSALWLPVAAGLAGAGLALLFAPRSGEETRKKIKDDVNELKQRADSSLQTARQRLDSGLEEAKATKSRLAGALRRTGKKAQQEMNDLTQETGESIKSEPSVLSNWEEEL